MSRALPGDEYREAKDHFYTPQCNGGIERWHSTTNSLLAKTVVAHQKDWPQRLVYVVAAYNATVHESTGYSPNFMTFGRELAVLVDLALLNPPADRLSVNAQANSEHHLYADDTQLFSRSFLATLTQVSSTSRLLRNRSPPRCLQIFLLLTLPRLNFSLLVLNTTATF